MQYAISYLELYKIFKEMHKVYFQVSIKNKIQVYVYTDLQIQYIRVICTH